MGVFFSHFSGILIYGKSKIGRTCTICQNVTVGSMRGKGCPVIGDNVVIFAGEKIVGDILVGSNVALAQMLL